jgi:hypothetical protein
MMTAACLKTYTLKVNSDGSLADPSQHPHHHSQGSGDPVPAEQILHEKATALASEQGLDYGTALARVMSHPNHRNLMEAYHAADERRPATKPVKDDPGAALHTKALEIMEKDDCVSYSQACAVAIERNPDLGQRWNS